MKQLGYKGGAEAPTGPSGGIGPAANLENANLAPLIVQIFDVFASTSSALKSLAGRRSFR
jgi:hypothetical protein